VDSHAPLSFSQESLWLTEEIVPGLSQYQMIVVVELGGELDLAVLQRSVRTIVRRHELLRSRFGRVDGVPSLIVCEYDGDVLGIVDLTSVPGPAAADVLRTVVHRWYTEPFDLGAPPLLRGEVIRLAPQRHVLVLATHHLVGDALSMGILQQELFACYAAHVAGREPDLPELPIQYADYTTWQRMEVEPELETGLAYWAQRLRDVPTVPFPVSRPRPPVRSFTSAWADVEFAPATMVALGSLAGRFGTSLFGVLVAAYHLLLARWTDTTDIVIGTPVAGRPEPEFENLFGFFVNSVVLRARCAPDEPFTALLSRVTSDLAADLAAEHVPFHRIVERINPPRDRARHPLFQTAFYTVADDDDERTRLGDLTVVDRSEEFLRSTRVTTEYDLVVEVVLSDTRPRASFRYATELFDADAVAELAARYGRLLAAIAADPTVAPELPPFRARPAAPAPPPSAGPVRIAAGAADGPVAEVLAIVAAELGLADVHPDDDFFDIGGSSLIGARVVQRLRDQLGVNVTLIDLFDAETLADLARACDARPAAAPTCAAARWWALNRLAGEHAGICHEPNALRLVGSVDEAALRAALADLAVRHEPLRTILPEIDGAVRRAVLAPAAPPFEVETVEADRLADAMTSAIAAPFDLTRDVPWRVRLYRSGTEQRLLLVVHRVATDAWSTRPLLRDLTVAYTARIAGRAPEWPPLPLAYPDFVAAHPELRTDRDTAHDPHVAQLAYWRKTLAGLPASMPLPADRPRPAEPDFAADRVIFDVPSTVYTVLAALARRHRANLFMVLHTAVAALLTRHDTGTDITIGCTVAGRDDRRLDDLVGALANTLLLRVSTEGDLSFAELLRRVRTASLSAFAHQDVPFARVQSELGLPVWPSQVSLTLCTAPVQRHDLVMPGLRAELAEAGTGRTAHDLAFEFTELRDGDTGQLWGAVEYATELFDDATVAGLVADLLDLLAAWGADPAAPIGDALLVAGRPVDPRSFLLPS
jgi:non-ribosomal peptide synthetase component F